MLKIMCKQCGRCFKIKSQTILLFALANNTIKQFINKVGKHLNIKIKWFGKGINEKGYDHIIIVLLSVIKDTLDQQRLTLQR